LIHLDYFVSSIGSLLFSRISALFPCASNLLIGIWNQILVLRLLIVNAVGCTSGGRYFPH